MNVEYRKLGKTGLEVSAIGLGTEHLHCDRETANAVLGLAVDAGVSYVDLLYVDSGSAGARFWGAYGPTLRAHRDQLVLALHWAPAVDYGDLDYCRRAFEDDLTALGNGYAEVALMTMVDTETKWQGWAQRSVEILQRYKAQGRIGAIGVSSHRALMALKMVESGLVDVLMYPLNVTSHAVEGAAAVCRACAEEGVGLVAMKPYRGGTLLTTEGQPSGITPAQCLAYVLSQPVAVALAGAKTADEFRATLHYLKASEAEKDYGPLLPRAQDYLAGECTGCDHCLPCPQDIDISQALHLTGWAGWARKDTDEGAEVRIAYDALPVKASACTECGVCEERCPFGVEIIAAMRRAVDLFAS